MAKRKKDLEDGSLPGLDKLFAEKEPGPGTEKGTSRPKDGDLSGDIPLPDDGPPPTGPGTGHKVKVSTTKGKVKGRARVPKKKSWTQRHLGPYLSKVRSNLKLVIPQDPVEKMRFKLRWLGLIKFPMSFIVIAIITIVTMLYLWYLYFDLDPDIMVYSRTLPILIIFLPIGVAMFSAIYFSFNLIVVDHFEKRMTLKIEGMLDGSIPIVIEKDQKKGRGPTKEEEDGQANDVTNARA